MIKTEKRPIIKCEKCRYFHDEHLEMEGTFGTCGIGNRLITKMMSEYTIVSPNQECWIQKLAFKEIDEEEKRIKENEEKYGPLGGSFSLYRKLEEAFRECFKITPENPEDH